MCLEQWPSQDLKVTYTVAVLLLQAIIPALVVGVVHTRIATHLRRHARGQRDMRRVHRELERNRRTTLLLTCESWWSAELACRWLQMRRNLVLSRRDGIRRDRADKWSFSSSSCRNDVSRRQPSIPEYFAQPLSGKQVPRVLYQYLCILNL